MTELTPEQEGVVGGGRWFELPSVGGPCWTSDRMAISREWIASREPPGTSWSLILYSAVSSVRREDYGRIVLSQPDGFAVKITMRALGSREACELLVEGLQTNPAVAPDAARLLQPYLDTARAVVLARGHTVDRSATTHTFRLCHGKQVANGIGWPVICALCLPLPVLGLFVPVGLGVGQQSGRPALGSGACGRESAHSASKPRSVTRS
jgi:hypothetical protein